MKRRSLLLAAPLGLGLASFSGAQSPYPSKPIRYIVPVTAGGGSDMLGRTVCERLGRVLGQTIVVDNLGGGGGVIASQTTARAPADGYTLMQGYPWHGTSNAQTALRRDQRLHADRHDWQYTQCVVRQCRHADSRCQKFS